MKANISSTIKAQLIRAAFYLLLLLAVCATPYAVGQRTTGEQSTTANMAQLPATSGDSGAGALAMPEFPMAGVWNQYDNPATEPPIGIGSQQFEPALNTLDDQVADDFVLTAPPPPMYLYITGVRVMGEYSTGGGPASSFNVYLYANGAGNLPGTLIASFLNRLYTGTPPDFMINLGNPFTLPSGTYWVSVQARQDFNTNGQWSGTTGLFKGTRALPGRTRATVTAPAASLGTVRTPACQTRYGPTRCSKSSASLRAPRPRQHLQLRLLPHLDLRRLRGRAPRRDRARSYL